MADYQGTEQLIRLLLARLERISADSIWAHQASRIRGPLLKSLDGKEGGEPLNKRSEKTLIHSGFKLLEQDAKGRNLVFATFFRGWPMIAGSLILFVPATQQ